MLLNAGYNKCTTAVFHHLTKFLIRHRKVDDGLEPAGKGFVDIGFQVGGKDNRAGKIFNAL